MSKKTAREILDAFDRGLEAAARSAKSNTGIAVSPSSKLLDAWTVRIVGSTQVNTLRKTYGNEFAKGYRGDTKLETLLKREGVKTVSQYLRRKGEGGN
jgi:hypothetical protein